MPAKLIIKKADSPVPESPGRWKAGRIVCLFETTTLIPPGSGESVEHGMFVHFTVSDRTVAQMAQYLSQYNRAIDMTVIQGPDANGFRRVNVRNNNCNASGTVGAWTVAGTDEVILQWNTKYPTCNLVTVGFPQPNTWTCEGTFTIGQAQEFNDTIVEYGLGVMDTRRIWYVSAAAMSNIITAGGSQTGTFAQLQTNLRDARLD
jgi:hypothetical protein